METRRLRRLIGRFGRYELAMLLSAIVIVAGIWVFLELASEVLEGSTDPYDQWIVKSLRNPLDPQFPIGPRWLVETARDITALGSYVVVTLVTLITTGFLLLQGKRGAMWLVLVATTGGALLSGMLKVIFSRPRPDVPNFLYVASASFPSGHAMLSAIIYLSLGVLLARMEAKAAVKMYSIGVAMVTTLLVGLSRVYLGVHYPTDVLAGWSAGLVWALGCWVVALYLQRRGAVESSGE